MIYRSALQTNIFVSSLNNSNVLYYRIIERITCVIFVAKVATCFPLLSVKCPTSLFYICFRHTIGCFCNRKIKVQSVFLFRCDKSPLLHNFLPDKYADLPLPLVILICFKILNKQRLSDD